MKINIIFGRFPVRPASASTIVLLRANQKNHIFFVSPEFSPATHRWPRSRRTLGSRLIKVSKIHFNQDQKLSLTRDSHPVKTAVGFEHYCAYKIRSNSNKISDRCRILNVQGFNLLLLKFSGTSKLSVNLQNLLTVFPKFFFFWFVVYKWIDKIVYFLRNDFFRFHLCTSNFCKPGN